MRASNVDPKTAEQAADDLLNAVHVDRDHSIPYCGGYSEDGETIYVDHDIDTKFVLGGKTVDVIKFLVVHECVEKALMDQYDLGYDQAHALATAAEDAVVSACGYDTAAYGKQWQQQIAKIAKRKDQPAPPADLDPRPYEDSKSAGKGDAAATSVLSFLSRKRPAMQAPEPDEPEAA